MCQLNKTILCVCNYGQYILTDSIGTIWDLWKWPYWVGCNERLTVIMGIDEDHDVNKCNSLYWSSALHKSGLGTFNE